MKRKQTVKQLLHSDELRGLLADIDRQAESIDAAVIVTVDNAGILEVYSSGSLIESLGLLEAGKNILLTDGENDAAD